MKQPTITATWASVPHDPGAYGSTCTDDAAIRYHDGIVEFLTALGWGNEIESMEGTSEAATMIYSPDYDEGDDNDYTMLSDGEFADLMAWITR